MAAWKDEIPAKANRLLANGERIVALDRRGNELARWVISPSGQVYALPKKKRYWKVQQYPDRVWRLG